MITSPLRLDPDFLAKLLGSDLALLVVKACDLQQLTMLRKHSTHASGRGTCFGNYNEDASETIGSGSVSTEYHVHETICILNVKSVASK